MIYIAYAILGSLAIIIALSFLFFLCRHNFCLAKTIFECISCYFDIQVAHETTEHLDVKSENHELKYTVATNKQSSNRNKDLHSASDKDLTLESHPQGKTKINFENSCVQYKVGFPTAIISSPLPSERHNSLWIIHRVQNTETSVAIHSHYLWGLNPQSLPVRI